MKSEDPKKDGKPGKKRLPDEHQKAAREVLAPLTRKVVIYDSLE